MIAKKFKIDFAKKTIVCKSRQCNVKELYSFLMDLFDEPENMKYDIPVLALAKNKFKLINGWTINEKSLKFIEGKIS